jgi:hypothetical protein
MTSPIKTTREDSNNPFKEEVYKSWRRQKKYYEKEIKNAGRGKENAREVGWLAAEAIARGYGQRKECVKQIKVQQV